MSRGLTATEVAAVSADVVYPALAAEFHFDEGIERYWTGSGTFSHGGNNWTGLGNLAGIDSVEESSEQKTNVTRLTLSGVSNAFYAVLNNTNELNRDCYIYFWLMDSDEPTTVDFDYLLRRGKMDKLDFVDQGDSMQLVLDVENKFSDIFRKRIVFYSDEDQQKLHEGDRFFRYIHTIPDLSLNFGGKANVGRGSGTVEREQQYKYD